MIKKRSTLKLINRIQNVYLILGIAAVLCSVIPGFAVISYMLPLVTGLLFLAIYSGLRFRKEWTVPLVLIISVWSLVQEFIFLARPLESTMVLSKPAACLFLLFYTHQIIVFSRRDTRAFLGCKGKVIIF